MIPPLITPQESLKDKLDIILKKKYANLANKEYKSILEETDNLFDEKSWENVQEMFETIDKLV